MSYDTNLLVMIGRLTADAKQTFFGEQKAVLNFSIANNQGEQKVAFFDVSLFGDRALSLLEHLTKGKKICVTGRLEQKKVNEKNYVNIIANNIDFC